MPSGKVHTHHTSQFHSSKYFLIFVCLVIKSVSQFCPFKAGSVIWFSGHGKSSTWQTHCLCPEPILIELTWNLSPKPIFHLFILRMIKQTKPYVMHSVTATWRLSTKGRETWTLRSILCYFSDSRRLGNLKKKVFMPIYFSSHAIWFYFHLVIGFNFPVVFCLGVFFQLPL